MRILKSLEEQETYLENKKKELGITLEQLLKCRNSGRRRTPEKKRLLEILKERRTFSDNSGN